MPHPVFCECCHHAQVLSNTQEKSCYDASTSPIRNDQEHERASECSLDRVNLHEWRHRGRGSGSIRGWGTRPIQILNFFLLVSVMRHLGKKLRSKVKITVPVIFILPNNDLFSEAFSMALVQRQFDLCFSMWIYVECWDKFCLL